MKVSKGKVGAAAALLACATLGACGSDDDASAGETWEVCISNGSFPPMYVNHSDGRLTGFDPDLARAAAEKMGLEIDFTKLAFEGLMPALASGRCSAVWSSFYISDERLQVADAVAYMNTGPGLVVSTGTTDIAEPDDLAGKTVAAQSGSTFIAQLEELNKQFEADGLDPVEVDEYKHYPEEVAAMTNDRADALIDSTVVLPNLVRKNPGLEIVEGFFPQDVQYGVYLEKDSALIGDLTDALDAMVEDGASANVAENYGLNVDDLVSPGKE